MHVRKKNVLGMMWCKDEHMFNLPGSRLPSWIFVIPTSCPRMAHCHPTDLSSGTHNLYDSAKKTLHDQTFPGSQNGNSTIIMFFSSGMVCLIYVFLLCMCNLFFVCLEILHVSASYDIAGDTHELYTCIFNTKFLYLPLKMLLCVTSALQSAVILIRISLPCVLLLILYRCPK